MSCYLLNECVSQCIRPGAQYITLHYVQCLRFAEWNAALPDFHCE